MSSQPKKPKSSGSKEPADKVPTMQERLEHAQAQRERWKRLSLQPGLSPQAALAARELAISWQAAAELGEKAVRHEQQQAAKPQTLAGQEVQPAEAPPMISPRGPSGNSSPPTSST